MNWLVRKIFGSGFGIGAPFWDQTFYWLVDTSSGRHHGARGEFYSFFPGLGAQLNSFEWRAPPPGERRRLAGMDFVVFSVSRGYFRDPLFDLPLFPMMWHVSWGIAGGASNRMETVRTIRARLDDPLADYKGALL